MRLYYDKGQHLGFLFHKRIHYEQEVLSKVLSLVKEGDLVFEIGSNIGQYALLLSEKIGTSGKLVCIEPDSDNFSFLSFNILKNQRQNVRLLQKAVSNKQDKATFHKDTKTGGRMGSLIKLYTGNHFEGRTEEVETITLHTLVKEYGIPDFVKVDVEGAETMIFSVPGSIMKSTKYMVEVQKETKVQICKLFQDEGFTAMNIENEFRHVSHPDEIPDFCNLLFVCE